MKKNLPRKKVKTIVVQATPGSVPSIWAAIANSIAEDYRLPCPKPPKL